jgi:hypothetical protein
MNGVSPVSRPLPPDPSGQDLFREGHRDQKLFAARATNA